MARGNTLANVLLMVKAELGYNLTPGVATQQDQELYWRIENKQQWLASQYDWPFLDTTGDVDCAAGSRFLSLPTNPVMNYDRPVRAFVRWNDRWAPIGYGIGVEEYNYQDSEASPAEASDPILKWNTNDNTEFEIWPVPITAQVVRFAGQRPVATLKTAGAFDPALTVDLDDQLVSLFVAADMLMRQKNADAKLKLETAQNRLLYLRAAGPAERRMFTLGGCSHDSRKIRRVVMVAGNAGTGGELLLEDSSGAILLE